VVFGRVQRSHRLKTRVFAGQFVQQDQGSDINVCAELHGRRESSARTMFAGTARRVIVDAPAAREKVLRVERP
jgi:hypothetical protein